MNRGNTTIIVIGVVIALLFFVLAGSIGGYFIWKNYFPEDDEEEKSGLIIPEDVVRDEEGFIDCGKSDHDEKSFDTPFMGIDFNKDEAFSCMGKNYRSNCSKARLAVNIDNIDFNYKLLSSNGQCYARMEAPNPSTGKMEWVQCPVSELTSFVNEQAGSMQGFKDLKEKMETGDGNFSASLFTALAVVLSENFGSIESFNCQTNL